MSNGGRRARRVLALLVLALLVFLLLEANRFLPGTWPGGGGDAGSKPTPKEEDRGPDPSRLPPPPRMPAMPEVKAPPWRIIVLSPIGKAVGPLTIVGDTTRHPMTNGAASLHGMEIFGRGFGVEDANGSVVLHGRLPSSATRDWVVQLPSAAVPKLGPPRPRPFRAIGPAGEPVPGARIQVQSGDGELLVTADALGKSVIPSMGGVMRLCVSADGFGEACTYTRPEMPGEALVRLPGITRVTTRFVDADTREPLKARARSIVERDGSTTILATPEGGSSHFETATPTDQAEQQSLEIEVEGRPIVRVPIPSLGAETAIPRGRRISLTVRDPAGKPIAGAQVEASFAPPGDAEKGNRPPIRATASTDASGTATIALPRDVAADVRVEADAFAPVGVRVEPGEADGTSKDVRLAPGVAWSVRVEGANQTIDGSNRPIAGADVVLIAKAGSRAARRSAKTDSKGVATLPPVAEGDAEVYAKAPGYAWTSARLRAGEQGPVTIALSKGERLRLIVEDGYGLPVEGARVRAVARGGSGQETETQGPDARPWETDANGVLDVVDVPVREFDLYLTKPGYSDEVISRVRPGNTTWFATLVRRN